MERETSRIQKRHRFSPVVRAIALILVVTFIVQDIAWAHPDNLITEKVSNNKLAPEFFSRERLSVIKAYARGIDSLVLRTARDSSGKPPEELSLGDIKSAALQLAEEDDTWFPECRPEYNVFDDEVVINFPRACSVRYFTYDPITPNLNKYPNRKIAATLVVNTKSRLYKQVLEGTVSRKAKPVRRAPPGERKKRKKTYPFGPSRKPPQKPGEQDMAAPKRIEAFRRPEDGDTPTNSFVRWHIAEERGVELDEKNETVRLIKTDRSNPRIPALEDKYRRNGVFEKIRRAKDPQLLRSIIETNENFGNLTPQEKRDLVETAQVLPLSFILGYVFIRNSTELCVAHVRSGFSRRWHGLESTFWMGELLFENLNSEEISRFMLEEAQHIVKNFVKVDGKWIHFHAPKGMRPTDPEAWKYIFHSQDFIDMLISRGQRLYRLRRQRVMAETLSSIKALAGADQAGKVDAAKRLKALMKEEAFQYQLGSEWAEEHGVLNKPGLLFGDRRYPADNYEFIFDLPVWPAPEERDDFLRTADWFMADNSRGPPYSDSISRNTGNYNFRSLSGIVDRILSGPTPGDFIAGLKNSLAAASRAISGAGQRMSRKKPSETDMSIPQTDTMGNDGFSAEMIREFCDLNLGELPGIPDVRQSRIFGYLKDAVRRNPARVKKITNILDSLKEKNEKSYDAIDQIIFYLRIIAELETGIIRIENWDRTKERDIPLFDSDEASFWVDRGFDPDDALLASALVRTAHQRVYEMMRRISIDTILTCEYLDCVSRIICLEEFASVPNRHRTDPRVYLGHYLNDLLYERKISDEDLPAPQDLVLEGYWDSELQMLGIDAKFGPADMAREFSAALAEMRREFAARGTDFDILPKREALRAVCLRVHRGDWQRVDADLPASYYDFDRPWNDLLPFVRLHLAGRIRLPVSNAVRDWRRCLDWKSLKGEIEDDLFFNDARLGRMLLLFWQMCRNIQRSQPGIKDDELIRTLARRMNLADKPVEQDMTLDTEHEGSSSAPAAKREVSHNYHNYLSFLLVALAGWSPILMKWAVSDIGGTSLIFTIFTTNAMVVSLPLIFNMIRPSPPKDKGFIAHSASLHRKEKIYLYASVTLNAVGSLMYYHAIFSPGIFSTVIGFAFIMINIASQLVNKYHLKGSVNAANIIGISMMTAASIFSIVHKGGSAIILDAPRILLVAGLLCYAVRLVLQRKLFNSLDARDAPEDLRSFLKNPGILRLNYIVGAAIVGIFAMLLYGNIIDPAWFTGGGLDVMSQVNMARRSGTLFMIHPAALLASASFILNWYITFKIISTPDRKYRFANFLLIGSLSATATALYDSVINMAWPTASVAAAAGVSIAGAVIGSREKQPASGVKTRKPDEQDMAATKSKPGERRAPIPEASPEDADTKAIDKTIREIKGVLATVDGKKVRRKYVNKDIEKILLGLHRGGRVLFKPEQAKRISKLTKLDKRLDTLRLLSLYKDEEGFVFKNSHIAILLLSRRRSGEMKSLIDTLRSLGITKGPHIAVVLHGSRKRKEVRPLVKKLRLLGITENSHLANVLGSSRKTEEVDGLVATLKSLGITESAHLALVLHSSRSEEEVGRIGGLLRSLGITESFYLATILATSRGEESIKSAIGALRARGITENCHIARVLESSREAGEIGDIVTMLRSRGITKTTHLANILAGSRKIKEMSSLIATLKSFDITKGAHLAVILHSSRNEEEVKKIVTMLKSYDISKSTHITYVLASSRDEEDIKNVIDTLGSAGITKNSHIALILHSSRKEEDMEDLIDKLRSLGITESRNLTLILSSSRKEKEIARLIEKLRSLGIAKSSHLALIIVSSRKENEMEGLVGKLRSLGITESFHLALVLASSKKEEEMEGFVGTLRSLGITKNSHIALILHSFRTEEEVKNLVAAIRSLGITEDYRIAHILANSRTEDETLSYIDGFSKLKAEIPAVLMAQMMANPGFVTDNFSRMLKEKANLPPLDRLLTGEEKRYVKFRLLLRQFGLKAVYGLIDMFAEDDGIREKLKECMGRAIKEESERLAVLLKAQKPSDGDYREAGLLLFSCDENIRMKVRNWLVEKHFTRVSGYKDDDKSSLASEILLDVSTRHNIYHNLLKDNLQFSSYIAHLDANLKFIDLILYYRDQPQSLREIREEFEQFRVQFVIEHGNDVPQKDLIAAFVKEKKYDAGAVLLAMGRIRAKSLSDQIGEDAIRIDLIPAPSVMAADILEDTQDLDSEDILSDIGAGSAKPDEQDMAGDATTAESPEHKIIILCNQNKERSPIAADILCSALPADLKDKKVGICSAALYNIQPDPVADLYVGHDAVLKSHQQHKVAPEEIREALLVFVMTEKMRRELVREYPDQAGKIRLILDNKDLLVYEDELPYAGRFFAAGKGPYWRLRKVIKDRSENIFAQIREAIEKKDGPKPGEQDMSISKGNAALMDDLQDVPEGPFSCIPDVEQPINFGVDYLSYLDRHRSQFEWIWPMLIPYIMRRSSVSGEKNISVAVLGSGTGEEAARVFHEIVTELVRRGEDPHEWEIVIHTVDNNRNILSEARRRTSGRRPLSYNYDKKYADEVIATLNKYSEKFRWSVVPHDISIYDMRLFNEVPEPDLVFANNVISKEHDHDKRRAMIGRLDRIWSNAFVVSTNGDLGEARVFHKTIVAPKTELDVVNYLAIPAAIALPARPGKPAEQNMAKGAASYEFPPIIDLADEIMYHSDTGTPYEDQAAEKKAYDDFIALYVRDEAIDYYVRSEEGGRFDVWRQRLSALKIDPVSGADSRAKDLLAEAARMTLAVYGKNLNRDILNTEPSSLDRALALARSAKRMLDSARRGLGGADILFLAFIGTRLAAEHQVTLSSSRVLQTRNVEDLFVALAREGALTAGDAERYLRMVDAQYAKGALPKVTLYSQGYESLFDTLSPYLPGMTKDEFVGLLTDVTRRADSELTFSPRELFKRRVEQFVGIFEGRFSTRDLAGINVAPVRSRFAKRQFISACRSVYSWLAEHGYADKDTDYDMGGTDIITPFYLTNAKVLRIRDALPFGYDEDENNPEYGPMRQVYLCYKGRKGYIHTQLQWAIGNAKVPIIWELTAMGVDPKDIVIERDAGSPGTYHIRFPWSYDGDAGKTSERTIIYSETTFPPEIINTGIVHRTAAAVYLRKADLENSGPVNTDAPVVVSFGDRAVPAGYRRIAMTSLEGFPEDSGEEDGQPYASIRRGAIFVRESAGTEKPAAPGWKAGDTVQEIDLITNRPKGPVRTIDRVEDGRAHLAGDPSNNFTSFKTLEMRFERAAAPAKKPAEQDMDGQAVTAPTAVEVKTEEHRDEKTPAQEEVFSPPAWAKGLRIYYVLTRNVARPGRDRNAFGNFTDLKFSMAHAKSLGFNAVFILPLSDPVIEADIKADSPYSLLSFYALDPRSIDWEVTGLKGETLLEKWYDFTSHAGKLPEGYMRYVSDERFNRYAHIKALKIARENIPGYPLSGLFAGRDDLSDEEIMEKNEYALTYSIIQMEQFYARQQLMDAVKYAHELNMKIGIDKPFFERMDGVEAKFNPGIFVRDSDGLIEPAGFNLEDPNPMYRQLWGLKETQRGLARYNWDELRKQNYEPLVGPIRYFTEELGFDFIRGDAFHYGYGQEGFYEKVAEICRRNDVLFIPETLGCRDERAVNGKCQSLGMMPINNLLSREWGDCRELGDKWRWIANYFTARSHLPEIWMPTSHDSLRIMYEYAALFYHGTHVETQARVLHLLHGLGLPNYSAMYGDEFMDEDRIQTPGAGSDWKQPSPYQYRLANLVMGALHNLYPNHFPGPRHDLSDFLSRINHIRDLHPYLGESGNTSFVSASEREVVFTRHSPDGSEVLVCMLNPTQITIEGKADLKLHQLGVNLNEGLTVTDEFNDSQLSFKREDGTLFPDGSVYYKLPPGGCHVFTVKVNRNRAIAARHRDALRRFFFNDSGLPGIHAGYPHFGDQEWGRDTHISMLGVIADNDLREEARDMLIKWAALEDNGSLPNVSGWGGGARNYNTSDAPLWFINAVNEYIKKADGDGNVLDEKVNDQGKTVRDALRNIMKKYSRPKEKVTDWSEARGVHMDSQTGLIWVPKQSTWMDTKFTERQGYACEIQALWFNANRVMAEMDPGNAAEYNGNNRKLKESFLKFFWNSHENTVYDILGTDGAQSPWDARPDPVVRCNQIFVAHFCLVDTGSVEMKAILESTRTRLLLPGSLRSQAPPTRIYEDLQRRADGVNEWKTARPPREDEKAHWPWCEHYDNYEGDASYHRGVAWCWPNPFYWVSAVREGTESRQDALATLRSDSLHLMWSGDTGGSLLYGGSLPELTNPYINILKDAEGNEYRYAYPVKAMCGEQAWSVSSSMWALRTLGGDEGFERSAFPLSVEKKKWHLLKSLTRPDAPLSEFTAHDPTNFVSRIKEIRDRHPYLGLPGNLHFISHTNEEIVFARYSPDGGRVLICIFNPTHETRKGRANLRLNQLGVDPDGIAFRDLFNDRYIVIDRRHGNMFPDGSLFYELPPGGCHIFEVFVDKERAVATRLHDSMLQGDQASERNAMLTHLAVMDNNHQPVNMNDVLKEWAVKMAADSATADSPLWLIELVGQYVRKPERMSLLDEKVNEKETMLDMLRKIVARYHRTGTDAGIHTNADIGFVWVPRGMTWMGPERQGYPCEIQALMYNADLIMCKLDPENAPKYEAHAAKIDRYFLEYFWNPHENTIYDILGTDGVKPPWQAAPDPAVRPNQILAAYFDLVKGDHAIDILESVGKRLLVPGALRSLARPEKIYEGLEFPEGQLPRWRARNPQGDEKPSWPWNTVYYDEYQGDQSLYNGIGHGWLNPFYWLTLAREEPARRHEARLAMLNDSLRLLQDDGTFLFAGSLPEAVSPKVEELNDGQGNSYLYSRPIKFLYSNRSWSAATAIWAMEQISFGNYRALRQIPEHVPPVAPPAPEPVVPSKTEPENQTVEILNTALRNSLCTFFFNDSGDNGRLCIEAGRMNFWHQEWGRDTMIALLGVISAGLHDEARQILVKWAGWERNGIIPNVRGWAFQASNENTSDAALWFVEALDEYIKATGRNDILDIRVTEGKTMLDVMRNIMDRYMAPTDQDAIHAHEATGFVYVPKQSTWMDTKYTPRQGYPVEIQALWYNALRKMTAMDPDAARVIAYNRRADLVKSSFLKYFWNDHENTVYDILGTDGVKSPDDAMPDPAVRSNQIFTVYFGLVEGDRAKDVIRSTWDRLRLPGSLRSLAKPLKIYKQIKLPGGRNGWEAHDPAGSEQAAWPYGEFHPWYETYKDVETRDRAYHNGTGWVWPHPFLMVCAVREGFKEKADVLGEMVIDYTRLMQDPFTGARPGAFGSLPELTDGEVVPVKDAANNEYLYAHPKGCGEQAWSVGCAIWALAEILRNKPGEQDMAVTSTAAGRPAFELGKGIVDIDEEAVDVRNYIRTAELEYRKEDQAAAGAYFGRLKEAMDRYYGPESKFGSNLTADIDASKAFRADLRQGVTMIIAPKGEPGETVAEVYIKDGKVIGYGMSQPEGEDSVIVAFQIFGQYRSGRADLDRKKLYLDRLSVIYRLLDKPVYFWVQARQLSFTKIVESSNAPIFYLKLGFVPLDKKTRDLVIALSKKETLNDDDIKSIALTLRQAANDQDFMELDVNGPSVVWQEPPDAGVVPKGAPTAESYEALVREILAPTQKPSEQDMAAPEPRPTPMDAETRREIKGLFDRHDTKRFATVPEGRVVFPRAEVKTLLETIARSEYGSGEYISARERLEVLMRFEKGIVKRRSIEPLVWMNEIYDASWPLAKKKEFANIFARFRMGYLGANSYTFAGRLGGSDKEIRRLLPELKERFSIASGDKLIFYDVAASTAITSVELAMELDDDMVQIISSDKFTELQCVKKEDGIALFDEGGAFIEATINGSTYFSEEEMAGKDRDSYIYLYREGERSRFSLFDPFAREYAERYPSRLVLRKFDVENIGNIIENERPHFIRIGNLSHYYPSPKWQGLLDSLAQIVRPGGYIADTVALRFDSRTELYEVAGGKRIKCKKPAEQDMAANEDILEIETIEWNQFIPLSEELRDRILRIITWQLSPDFARGRSGYVRLPEPMIIEVPTVLGVRRFKLLSIKLKNIGDFSDPEHPAMPGADVPGYVQHDLYPEIHPEIDTDCNMHPVVVPPIARGGDSYRFNMREYAHTGEALFKGADVGVPFAVAKLKNRNFNGEPLGAVVLGCFEEDDRRFAHIFNGAVLELDSNGRPVLTVGEYARQVIPNPEDISSVFEYVRTGIMAWGSATRGLSDIGLLHPATHPFNISFVDSKAYYHDLIETKWARDFSPEQAFLYQLTWPIAHGLCGLEMLLLNTDLGPPMIMTYFNTGQNPYKDWLHAYFSDAPPQALEMIDELADELFDKNIAALRRNAAKGRLSDLEYVVERQITYAKACIQLFPVLETVQDQLRIRAPYSADEFRRRYNAYAIEANELAQKLVKERGSETAAPAQPPAKPAEQDMALLRHQGETAEGFGGQAAQTEKKVTAIWIRAEEKVYKEDDAAAILYREKFRAEIEKLLAGIEPGQIKVQALDNALNHNNEAMFHALGELRKAVYGMDDGDVQKGMCKEAGYDFGMSFAGLFKGHSVYLIEGVSYYDELAVSADHYWVLIDDSIIVDITYGQFNPAYRNRVLVTSADADNISSLIMAAVRRSAKFVSYTEAGEPPAAISDIPARIGRDEIEEAIDYINVRAGRIVFEDGLKSELAEKIDSMGLVRGGRFLAVGVSEEDRLPLLLSKLGLRVSIAGVDSVSGLKETGFDYVSVFGALGQVITGSPDEGSCAKKMDAFIESVVSRLAPSGGVIYVNSMAKKELYYLDEAVKSVCKKAGFEPEIDKEADVGMFTMNPRYISFATTGAVYRIKRSLSVAEPKSAEQDMAAKYPQGLAMIGNEDWRAACLSEGLLRTAIPASVDFVSFYSAANVWQVPQGEKGVFPKGIIPNIMLNCGPCVGLILHNKKTGMTFVAHYLIDPYDTTAEGGMRLASVEDAPADIDETVGITNNGEENDWMAVVTGGEIANGTSLDEAREILRKRESVALHLAKKGIKNIERVFPGQIDVGVTLRFNRPQASHEEVFDIEHDADPLKPMTIDAYMARLEAAAGKPGEQDMAVSIPEPQESEADKTIKAINDRHTEFMGTQAVSSKKQVILSANAFRPKAGSAMEADIEATENRTALMAVLNKANIAILEPEEIRKVIVKNDINRNNLTIVMTEEDFRGTSIFNNSQKASWEKSNVLILEDRLTGANYLYLQGVIGLAQALMRDDEKAVMAAKSLYQMMTGKVMSDEMLDTARKNPIAFAVNNMLKFKPIVPRDAAELDSLRRNMEKSLTAA